MHQNCEECTRLWNEYALATRHFLKLQVQLQVAASSGDARLAAQLSPLVTRAAEERFELCRLIELHDTQKRANASAFSG